MAFAQEEGRANVAPPPENFVVSPGGVDMRSGRYAYSQTDLAIGSSDGGLSFTRTLVQPVLGHSNPFANFSHNWDILVSEKRVNIQQDNYRHNVGHPDYQIEISFGGRTETFRQMEQVSRSGFAQLSLSGQQSSDAAVYTLRTGDGVEAVFRPIGSNDCSSQLRCAYVSQITQADGTRLIFEYDSLGPNATRLRSVTSNRGYALVLEYSSTLVVKACLLNLAIAPKPANNICPANAAATATYGYDSNALQTRLASATDAGSATSTFVNQPNSIGFVRPGETTPWLTNTIGNRTDNDQLVHQIVNRQDFADGSHFTYSYDETPPVCGEIPDLVGGSYTNNLNQTVQVRYAFPTRPYPPTQGYGDVSGTCEPTNPIVHQVTPGPVTVTDALNRTTTTDYCDPTAAAGYPSSWRHRCLVSPVPVSVTGPSGIKTVMTWDMYSRTLLQTRQIAVPGSGLPDIVRSSTYACSLPNFRFCTKPVTETDARGAVTENSYDPAHGGLLTQTLPAPAPGAPRPQTRHEYAQRHAWIASGGGGYVQAASPVWVRTATSICRTSAATGNPAAPCAVAGDEVRTTYDYGPNSGPNNLLLRGQVVTADGQSLRTCYGYDSRGNRISETQPNANLAACP